MTGVRWPKLRLFLALIGILTGIIEYGLASHVAWLGIKPDFTLVLAVLAGLAFGSYDGAVAGFFAALVPDLWGGRYLGVLPAVHLAVGFLAGLVERRVFKENIAVPLSAGILGTLTGNILALLLYRALGVPFPAVLPALSIMLRSSLYNGLLAPFVYVVLIRLRTAVRAAGAPGTPGAGNG